MMMVIPSMEKVLFWPTRSFLGLEPEETLILMMMKYGQLLIPKKEKRVSDLQFLLYDYSVSVVLIGLHEI